MRRRVQTDVLRHIETTMVCWYDHVRRAWLQDKFTIITQTIFSLNLKRDTSLERYYFFLLFILTTIREGVLLGGPFVCIYRNKESK